MGRRDRRRTGGRLPSEEKVIEVMERLDWTAHLRGPLYLAECARCATSFRSHVAEARVVGLLSKEGCPSCGSHLVNRAHPDLEHGTR